MNTPTKNTDLQQSERLKKQLDFIIEVDKLKHILRRTLLTDASRRENDAEHSWHLALAAIILEEYACEKINMEKVLKMVIVHDLVEIYAGDTFAFDVQAHADKENRELLAADTLFSQLPSDMGSQIRALWEEFDAMQSADALFAASLDRLQPFLHNTLTGGHTWIAASATVQQVLDRMEPVKRGLPALWPWVAEYIEIGIQEGWIIGDCR
ncbi:MAG: HD domain-containing protein [Spirochaetales bacterium]